MKIKGYSFKCENPFFVYFKKHYCPCCGNRLVRLKVSEVIHKDGTAGADYWLKMYGQLPSNYINKTALLAAGWYRGQAPSDYVPGKMATMGIYQNREGHLPSAPGRIWYEADINYYSGKRNSQRVLWSNDGLVFVSYDHYRTFVEII